jgi:hypothetical protein
MPDRHNPAALIEDIDLSLALNRDGGHTCHLSVTLQMARDALVSVLAERDELVRRGVDALAERDAALERERRLKEAALDAEGCLLGYWTDIPESEEQRLTVRLRAALAAEEEPQKTEQSSGQWCLIHNCHQDDPRHPYEYPTCEHHLRPATPAEEAALAAEEETSE